MSSGKEKACPEEIIASAPGDIQVIVYGDAFPAKKLKKGVRGRDGCFEVGDWLTNDRRQELRRLMSYPLDNPATVFQIVVNVPPMRRLICEWPHENLGKEGRYYFTQLVDLDG